MQQRGFRSVRAPESSFLESTSKRQDFESPVIALTPGRRKNVTSSGLLEIPFWLAPAGFWEWSILVMTWGEEDRND